ncbi:MAG: DUF488 domain-containing protein [Elusimicrobia bacterium]|nr:DUF488 domain-containing protein [Elusimicrobiota bacterium]
MAVTKEAGDGALYTIGHSTRTLEEFLSLLEAFSVKRLVDVRTVPKSRHVPWFNKETLPAALKSRGILYTHLKALGGLRHARKDSQNGGWRNASFRGYADYMATPNFARGVEALNRLRAKRRVAIMCAEAVPWRCHRSMIADAEAARGIAVRHIMSAKTANPHKLTSFAVVDRRSDPPVVRYPPYEHA